ncbi:MAG: hypothetical protein HKN87_01480 [Saprospiraceae bacterium]|nr:hypothetical protein [Saprospiraceae bacterium]
MGKKLLWIMTISMLVGGVTYFAVDKMLTNRRIDELVERERVHCEEKQLAVQRASVQDFAGQLMTLVAAQSSNDIWDEDYREVSKYFQEITQRTKIVKLLFINDLGVVEASNRRSEVGDNVSKQYDSQMLSTEKLIQFSDAPSEEIVTLRFEDEEAFIGHLVMHYRNESVGVSPH